MASRRGSKPVSRSRMADLLFQSGQQTFLGFESTDWEDPTSSTGTVSPSFDVVLKLLSKRDCTSKLKALQDFTGLCKSEVKDDTLSALPFWTVMFKRLTLDLDPRVREACHKGMQSLIEEVRKDFAPSLKSVIGHWVCAMNDPYPPAAAAATRAFNTAFNEAKQISVYLHGFQEILRHVDELLFDMPLEKAIDRKLTNREEWPRFQELVLSQGISSLTFLISKLSDHLSEKQKQSIDKLWRDKRFWKCSENSSTQVRLTFFKGCVSVLKLHPQALSEQMCKSLVQSLKEKDPKVAVHVLEALLLIVDTQKDWNSYFDIKREFLPSLWVCLGNVGGSAARSVFPCFLPLLHRVHSKVVEADNSFSVTFLKHLTGSFMCRGNTVLVSDLDAMLTSFNECFIFLLSKNNHVDDKDFLDIISDVLRYGFNATVLLGKMVFTHCGNLLTSLHSSKSLQTFSVKLSENFKHSVLQRLSSSTEKEMFISVSKFLEICYTEDRLGGSDQLPHSTVSPVLPEVFSECVNLLQKSKCGGFFNVMATILKVDPSANDCILQQAMRHLLGEGSQSIALLSRLLESVGENMTSWLKEPTGGTCIASAAVCIVSVVLVSQQSEQAAAEIVQFCELHQQLRAVILLKSVETSMGKKIADQLLPALFKDVTVEGLQVPFYQELLEHLFVQPEVYSLDFSVAVYAKVCDLVSSLITESLELLPRWLSLLGHPNRNLLTTENIERVFNILRDTLLVKSESHFTDDGSSFATSFQSVFFMCDGQFVPDFLQKILGYLTNSLLAVNIQLERTMDICEALGLLVNPVPEETKFGSCLSSQAKSLVDKVENKVSHQLLDDYVMGRQLFLPTRNIHFTVLNDKQCFEMVAMAILASQLISHGNIDCPAEDTAIVQLLGVSHHIIPFQGNPLTLEQFQKMVSSSLKQLISNCHKGSQLSVVLQSVYDRACEEGGMFLYCLEHALFHSLEYKDVVEEFIRNTVEFSVTLRSADVLHCILNVLESAVFEVDAGPFVPSVPQVPSFEDALSALCQSVLLLSFSNYFKSSTAAVKELLLQVALAKDTVEVIKSEESISECTAERLDFMFLLICAIGELLTKDHHILPEVCDYVLCFLITCVQEHSEDHTSSIRTDLLYSRIFNLIVQFGEYFSSEIPAEAEKREWHEFFRPAFKDSLQPLYHNYLSSPPKHLSHSEHLLMYHCCFLGGVLLEDAEVSFEFADLTRSITCDWYCLQVAATRFSKRLSVQFSDSPESDTTEIRVKLESLKSHLGDILLSLKGVLKSSPLVGRANVQKLLLERPVEDQSLTTLLLVWLVLVEVLQSAPLEEKVHLQEWIKETDTFSTVMRSICYYLTPKSQSSSPDQLKVTLRPQPHQLAFAVYLKVSQQLPAALRQWYLTLNRQDASEIEKFTSASVSPTLRKSHLSALQPTTIGNENMQVKVFTEVSEVAVTYKVDDASIELHIILPTDYPIHPPEVKEGRRIRVEASQWRKWMLQLHIFLVNQNGSLRDGLLLWKSNLDKHFAGVQDCMICFSVIHTSDYSLPKLACKTCHNKFHSSCLYKWFNTSGKGNCPLCRNFF